MVYNRCVSGRPDRPTRTTPEVRLSSRRYPGVPIPVTAPLPAEDCDTTLSHGTEDVGETDRRIVDLSIASVSTKL